MGTRWIVDASNVIGSRPDGWWTDKPLALRRLVGEIARWRGEAGRPVLVVADGHPTAATPEGTIDGVHVRYAHSSARDAADDEIVRIVTRHFDPGSIVVATSDRDLRARVRALGAQVEGAGRFRTRIEETAPHRPEDSDAASATSCRSDGISGFSGVTAGDPLASDAASDTVGVVLDYIFRGGNVVDGTGAAARRADVGVEDGRIVAVGEITEEAGEVIDVTGRVVAPGIIDPHCHYDAQLLWDPLATPSNFHGVTTVVNGNCGFGLAPLAPGDGDYLRRMMARVEGMPLPALEQGVEWNWETFPEYLDRLEGAIGVNAAFMAGHCAIRRYVMGDDAVGSEATADQTARMAEILDAMIKAGALGFSTGRSGHQDGDGNPVASRWAGDDEVFALCDVVAANEGTTLEVVLQGCLDLFSDEEVEFLTEMSLRGGRPINWNVLSVDSADPERTWHQIAASEKAAERGARIVALTMPILVPMNMNFHSFCALNLLPGWGDVLAGPVEERIPRLRDPDVRRGMQADAAETTGALRRIIDFDNYVIGDTYSAANDGLTGRRVHEIAADRGTEPFDTLLDIVLADDLRTVVWPSATDNDAESWKLRAEIWDNEHVMIGGSDAGAHLDRMSGAPYPTKWIGDCLRGRKLTSMERAIEMMTAEPADLFGIRDRGRLVEGNHADLWVFDPETVDATMVRLVEDLPGDSPRLVCDAIGVDLVMVNGIPIVRDGEPTGQVPGAVLRSGRDTATVAVPGITP